MSYLRETCIAGLLSFIVALLFLFPWTPNDSSIPVPYDRDAESYAAFDVTVWTFAYTAADRGLAEGGGWFEAPFLHPLSNPLAMMDHRLLEGLWSAPLFLLLEPLTAWGWLLLITLTLTSTASYLSGRILTRSPWGGAAMAILFAFGPLAAGSVAFSFFLQNFTWLPILLLSLLLFLESPTPRRSVLLSAMAAVTAVDYSYHAPFLAVVFPPLLLLGGIRRNIPVRRILLVLSLAGSLAIIPLLPMARSYAEFHAATGIERSHARVAAASADLLSFLAAPNGALILPFGAMIEPLVKLPGSHLFPGIIVLIMAWAGGRAFLGRLPEAWFPGLFALIWAIGTGERLLWSLGLQPMGIGFFTLLRKIPIGRAFGTPTTVAPFIALLLGAAGAFAAAEWASKGGRRRLLVILLLLLSFAEARGSMHEVRIRPDRASDPAYKWLAEQDPDAVVLDLPMGRIGDLDGQKMETEALWGILIHGRRTPNGSTTTILPWHDSIAAHLSGPDSTVALAVTNALGARYIISRGAEPPSFLDGPVFSLVYASPGAYSVFENGRGLDPHGERGLDPHGERGLEPAGSPEELISILEGVPHDRLSNPALGRGRIELSEEGGEIAETGGAEGGGDPISLSAQTAFELPVRITNLSSATWCASASLFPDAREVSLGIRSWTATENGESMPIDYLGNPLTGRGFLPYDLPPGDSCVVILHGLSPRRTGRYNLSLGLLIEDLGWFPDSNFTSVEVEVSSLLGPSNLLAPASTDDDLLRESGG